MKKGDYCYFYNKELEIHLEGSELDFWELAYFHSYDEKETDYLFLETIGGRIIRVHRENFRPFEYSKKTYFPSQQKLL